MRIQNNIMAINTHRSYSINNEAVSKSAEKLSSGYRINRAGDDAAGLAISEKMRAQIRGLNMATKNSQDAISLVQTAEGALQETHNILQRMRELSVQSASDTNEKVIDRGALQQEFAQLQSEIDDIASKTRFNDQNLIDGTFQKYKSTLNVGATDFTGATMMVDRAAGGTHNVKVAIVDVGSAVPVSGTVGHVGFGTAVPTATSGSISVGGTAGVNDSGFNQATITWTAAATGEHAGNTYTFSVSGSTASSMTINLLDSNGNVVATKQNVDFTEAKAATEDPLGVDPDTTYPFEVSFTGVGTLTIERAVDSTGLGDTAASASALIAGLGGQQITHGTGANGGRTASYEPATRGYISMDIDGEVVKLYKGDTSAVFEKSGITLQFDAITDADLIEDTSTKFGYDADDETEIVVNQSKGATMVIQTGANQGDELAINIDAMNTRMLGVAASDISTREKASQAITQVNSAINQVSTQRAALGALQNRLDHKIANLKVSSENLTAAESRIRDVDIASEMTTFTKNNILAQAATAMLAQANSAPQNVLSLLR